MTKNKILLLLGGALLLVGLFFWWQFGVKKIVKTPEQLRVDKQQEDAKKYTERVRSLLTKDHDLDGISDEEEKKYGTNPLLHDTDSDGLSDPAEIFFYKTDPLKADTDGDGVNDGQEIRAKTNPNDKNSLPKKN